MAITADPHSVLLVALGLLLSLSCCGSKDFTYNDVVRQSTFSPGIHDKVESIRSGVVLSRCPLLVAAYCLREEPIYS